MKARGCFRRRRGFIGLGLVATVAAAWPESAMGQETTSVAPSDSVPTASQRAQVYVDSSTASVGFALYIPGGSAADPIGQEGAAVVLSETLSALLDPQIRSIAADAEIVVGQEGVTVLGRASPGAFAPLVQAIQRTFFEAPVPLLQLEQARANVLSRLRFESGAPVRTFQDAVAALVFQAFPGWSHTPSGTLSTVEAIDLPRLASGIAFIAAARELATAAVVGPVDEIEVRSLIDELLGPGDRLPGVAAPVHAWTEPARHEITAEITSTWVAVALPVRADTPAWRVELLAHHIAEVLEPDPPRPGLVSPEVRIVHPGGLPIILVTFAIFPERAGAWVDRVLATARLETDAPPDERFFRWQRRRFRTVWLSERARPERRAERLARGWAGNTPAEIEAPFDIGVWRTDLEDVARALGQPRIVIYGPALGSAEPLESWGLVGPDALDPH